ncbi:MAG: Bacteriophage Mu Gam like protein [Phycisphaerales bacterium]|nr:Bacteriophage Mu Gam like protein [Phycisphaerales bacterium]
MKSIDPNEVISSSAHPADGGEYQVFTSQFRIQDERSANWLVRRICEARAYAEKVETWAAAEIHQARQKEARLMQRFGAELEAWATASIQESGGRVKSIRLPAGQIGYRTVPLSIEVQDGLALTEWCERYLPKAVRVTVRAEGHSAVSLIALSSSLGESISFQHQPVIAEVSRYTQETGELPPGTVIRPASEKFYIR